MKSITDRDLKIGDTVYMYNGSYEVSNIYQISEEYMKEHNLCYKNRITLKCIKNGEIRDFAIPIYKYEEYTNKDVPLF